MKIPTEILAAAEHRVLLGGSVVLAGKYKGRDAYFVDFELPAPHVGLPEVYLWDGGRVRTLAGRKALDVLRVISSSVS